MIIPLFIGFEQTQVVVWDFFHQPYSSWICFCWWFLKDLYHGKSPLNISTIWEAIFLVHFFQASKSRKSKLLTVPWDSTILPETHILSKMENSPMNSTSWSVNASLKFHVSEYSTPCTPPKTNMELENSSWKRRNIYKLPLFGFHVSFRGCIRIIFHD